MRTTSIIIFIFLFASCTDAGKGATAEKDKRIGLRTDTLNVVTLKDTMVIYESTCRGCAYEGSTNFDIEDTLDVVKISSVVTTDNNPSDMAGGSVSKDVVLVPLKVGSTTIKFYKFWKYPGDAKDSLNFKLYNIEVKN